MNVSYSITPYTYNTQALIGLVCLNLLILVGVALTWAGWLSSKRAQRWVKIASLAVLVIVLAHAAIMPAIAR